MKFSPQKQKFIDSATDMFGVGSILSKQQVRDASANANIPKAGWFMKAYKIGYNQFKLIFLLMMLYLQQLTWLQLIWINKI